MTARHRVTNITFLVGPDKVSPATRYDRGVVVAEQAPGSALCAQHADLKAAAGAVVTSTASLKTIMDGFTNAAAGVGIARTALTNLITQWDGAYSVFVSTGEKHVATPADVHALGAVALVRASYPLVPPVSVAVKYDAAKNLIRVRVHRAPGLNLLEVQMSPDPVTATSWTDLVGTGAMHVVPNPAKATWWFRACSVAAQAKSDFTTPVSVIVR
jgi:hypothetical protein